MSKVSKINSKSSSTRNPKTGKKRGKEEVKEVKETRILHSSLNQSEALQLYHFTQGLDVDRQLYKQEIRVQKAWVNALLKAGQINIEEKDKLHEYLDKAQQLIADGTFPWKIEDEDIHMNLERFITEEVGNLGKRMHQGRSRNDLIATTLRLYTHDMAQECFTQVTELMKVVIRQAENHLHTFIPGMTHFQHGQAIRLGHLWSSYAWTLERDRERYLRVMDTSLGFMPLGSGALSGTTLEVDFTSVAEELGFRSTSFNSYDAVGDRDFMLELLYANALCGAHLGKICEDIIYGSSTAVGLFILPLAWSTGSSMMPNKRNPDVCELIRAKSGRLISLGSEGASIVKSCPSSYNSDLHELKRSLMTSLQELMASLQIFTSFFRELRVNNQQANNLLHKGHILATELADFLASKGIPFREAYRQVAELIQLADRHQKQIHELGQLPKELWQALSPELEEGFLKNINFAKAVEKRNREGGTSLKQLQKSLLHLKSLFS